MIAQTVQELGEFHRFVGEIIRRGDTALTPEQAVEEWRSTEEHPVDLDDDLDAIQEAIDDMEAGEVGMLFEEFDRDFRNRHNLPPAP